MRRANKLLGSPLPAPSLSQCPHLRRAIRKAAQATGASFAICWPPPGRIGPRPQEFRKRPRRPDVSVHRADLLETLRRPARRLAMALRRCHRGNAVRPLVVRTRRCAAKCWRCADARPGRRHGCAFTSRMPFSSPRRIGRQPSDAELWTSRTSSAPRRRQGRQPSRKQSAGRNAAELFPAAARANRSVFTTSPAMRQRSRPVYGRNSRAAIRSRIRA